MLVRPRLTPEDDGKFVVIDIETGDFAIGLEELSISLRMSERYPAERLWLMRVGHAAPYKLGFRSTYQRLFPGDSPPALGSAEPPPRG